MKYWFLITLLIYTFAVQSALACACCADRGERFVFDRDRSPYAENELARLNSKGLTRLFVTACDLECVKGIEDPLYDYDFTMSFKDWTLNLSSMEPAGTIAFSLPETFKHYAVDLTPLAESPHVNLFSEYRFDGVVSASGVFQAATGMKAQLILTGTGNHCWSSNDVTHWSLDVRGQSVEFRLFGGVGAIERGVK